MTGSARADLQLLQQAHQRSLLSPSPIVFLAALVLAFASGFALATPSEDRLVELEAAAADRGDALQAPHEDAAAAILADSDGTDHVPTGESDSDNTSETAAATAVIINATLEVRRLEELLQMCERDKADVANDSARNFETCQKNLDTANAGTRDCHDMLRTKDGELQKKEQDAIDTVTKYEALLSGKDAEILTMERAVVVTASEHQQAMHEKDAEAKKIERLANESAAKYEAALALKSADIQRLEREAVIAAAQHEEALRVKAVELEQYRTEVEAKIAQMEKNFVAKEAELKRSETELHALKGGGVVGLQDQIKRCEKEKAVAMERNDVALRYLADEVERVKREAAMAERDCQMKQMQ